MMLRVQCWAYGVAEHPRRIAFDSCWRRNRSRNRSRGFDAAGRRVIPATAHSTNEGCVRASAESAQVKGS